jgi:tetraether lipid synthase
VLRDEIVTTEVQHDLDRLGIAKTAREEKTRARNEKIKHDAQYNEKMAKLYREVVLKEKAPVAENGFLPLSALSNGGIAPAPKPEVEEPVAGD